MLPLLPALILLLLQGPSNIERLAHEGRLPAMIDAVHASLERPALKGHEQQAVLAQLLAATSNVDLSRALVQLLTVGLDEPVEASAPLDEPEETPAPLPAPPSLRLTDGFTKAGKVRDGPERLLDC